MAYDPKTANAKAALSRLLASATDQATLDDLAIVVHAMEDAKGAMSSAAKTIAEHVPPTTFAPRLWLHEAIARLED